jgi:glucosamine 6-phosphate synthetase-like amidotransferase/phosphosugar isomerase protein
MIGAQMLADIGRTPAVLDALAVRGEEIASFARQHLAPDVGGHLYVYGCGDGLVAAECLAGPALIARTALDFLVYDVPRLSAADRVLAVSMSGNVDRGVECAEAALARGMRVAVLTNGNGGRLGGISAPRLSLGIPAIKPFLPGTATYNGTLFALQQIVAALSGTIVQSPGPHVAGLAAQAQAALANLPAPAGVRFLSAGINRATAAHGAAKLVEATRLPVWHADIEEFAHSQFWSVKPDELIVYLVANKQVAQLASHSAGVLRDMGFATLAIATQDCLVPEAGLCIETQAVGETASPLALVIPVQVLAWRLACATGLDPDTRSHLKDDELRFRTSRRLTRSTLVGTGH